VEKMHALATKMFWRGKKLKKKSLTLIDKICKGGKMPIMVVSGA
jgi:hypothetical protein